MFNLNYNKVMQAIIFDLSGRPKLLLHCCCAPCATHCINLLEPYFEITVYFYNPNIEPEAEFYKRKAELVRFLNQKQIPLLETNYNPTDFHQAIRSLPLIREGGQRCTLCIYHRLKKTKEMATKLGMAYFGTTLTISPHKNSQLINNLGRRLQDKQTQFLFSDFKKEAGFLKSLELSRALDLYRQDYCGCLASKKQKSSSLTLD